MELDKTTGEIKLQHMAEYAVVRHGLALGLDMVRRNQHPSFSEQDLVSLEERYNAMKILPEELPYNISTMEARLALCGIAKARPPEKPSIRELRQDIKFDLIEILETAGVCFNKANGKNEKDQETNSSTPVPTSG